MTYPNANSYIYIYCYFIGIYGVLPMLYQKREHKQKKRMSSAAKNASNFTPKHLQLKEEINPK